MKFLTRQQLIYANAWPIETVETEQGRLRLAAPSALDADKFSALRKELGEKGGPLEVVAEALRISCVDDAGVPSFEDADEAFGVMGALSVGSVNRLVEAFARLSNEAAVGKAPASPSNASPTGSA